MALDAWRRVRAEQTMDRKAQVAYWAWLLIDIVVLTVLLYQTFTSGRQSRYYVFLIFDVLSFGVIP